MKKLFRFILFWLIGAALLLGTWFALPDPYTESYQRVLVRQVDALRAMESPKLVFIGQSTLCFGLDLGLMEELSGKPCAILGLHGGLGMTYYLETALDALGEGDVAVIEAVTVDESYIGEELFLSGAGRRLDLYPSLYGRQKGKVLGAFPGFVFKWGLEAVRGGYEPEGVYRADSFDERGGMILEREECVLPSPYDEAARKRYGSASFGEASYREGYLAYLEGFAKKAEAKGARVCFIPVAYIDECVLTDDDSMEEYDRSLSEILPAPYISHQSDYIFPRDLVYDNCNHLNTKGAEVRTRLIWRDLMLLMKQSLAFRQKSVIIS